MSGPSFSYCYDIYEIDNYVYIYFFFRCRQWVEASKNPRLDGLDASTLYKKARLCEDHFSSWCFLSPRKSKLVKNAVPDVLSRPEKGSHTTNLFINESHISDQTMASEISYESETPVSTTFASSICMTPKRSHAKYTPRKVKLASELKKQRDVTRNLKKRYAKLKKLYSVYKKPKKMKYVKEALLQANLDKNLMNLILSQVRLRKKKQQGHRFTNEEKLFAYNLLCKGKAAYRCMRTLIQLPSESALRRFLTQKFSEPGVNVDVIKRISTCLENKPVTQRVYALVFDETSIKPRLVYNPIADNISGFEDFGTQGRKEIVANQVLVIMIRSLQGKKKLPICYYFSNGSLSSDMLKAVVDEVLEKLSSSNVVIKAMICDQGSCNCRLFSLLGITPEKPYFLRNGEKIYGIYDPPHLLKTLRRNLMKYDLETANGIVSFKHIRDFYKADSVRHRRTAEKLTDKHVFATGLNSMKVSLAAQIFSHRVHVGMSLLISEGLISATADKTAEFIATIDELFDSMNGTSIHPTRGKKFHCAASDSSPHIKFWENLVVQITSWKFVHAESEESASSKPKRKIPNLKSKTGWLQTLSSMLELYKDLKALGFSFLMTKRLNQDCLENFFSQIRGLGGHNTNPDAYEFNTHFRIASVKCLTISRKNKNCEDDQDEFLTNLLAPSLDKNEQSTESVGTFFCLIDRNDFMVEEHFSTFDRIEKNVLSYLAGFIGLKVTKLLKCDLCYRLLLDIDKTLLDDNFYIYLREYEISEPENAFGLKYPSPGFLECFAAITRICDEAFATILHKNKLMETVRNMIANKEIFEFLIDCEEHYGLASQKIILYSSNLLLKIHLRELNRGISRQIFDLKQLRAKKIY